MGGGRQKFTPKGMDDPEGGDGGKVICNQYIKLDILAIGFLFQRLPSSQLILLSAKMARI